MALDTSALRKGRIVLKELPDQFRSIKKYGRSFIQFDRANNCWVGNQHILLKVEPDGKQKLFSSSSGLGKLLVSFIFRDREDIVWIAAHTGGVLKLVDDNFTFFEIARLTYPPYGDIAYDRASDQWLLFEKHNHELLHMRSNEYVHFAFTKSEEINRIIATGSGIFATGRLGIYRLTPRNNFIETKVVYRDSVEDIYGSMLVDKHGNLIICREGSIVALVDGKTVIKKKLNSFVDYAAQDSKGNIWIATRSHEVYKFELRPNDLANYLDQQFHFHKKVPVTGPSPRCLVIDRDDNVWIGTRQHGIHVYQVSGDSLLKKCTITATMGLSDNFTWHLACDSNNNIWAASPLGLDRISLKNEQPVIENLTKQNSIYQSVFNTVIDKNNTAWVTTSNGLIRISPETRPPSGYLPALMLGMVKAGKDTVADKTNGRFSYQQNNISFHFAATSFLDEKQVMYTYRLLGGSNNSWSEPSNHSEVTFIDLPPGEYVLEIKARFPADRYPEQKINYSFAIAPPWWASWWFRTLFVIGAALLLSLALRFYYRRKMEKRLAQVEKQQAIEKERTRIATDMHDDLGAGLSRIKFLSENVKANKGNDEVIMEDIQKISAYSDEMAQKMGEIVWALNERNDTVADLVAYTRSFALEYLSSRAIECDLFSPIDLPAIFIPGEMRQNIFLSVKECLHNIVKHAGATRVRISVRLEKEIEITIQDNGRGINWAQLRPFSNGIQNIRKRMNDINGKVEFLNDSGTSVILSAPYNL
jgi:signal transduction histidine kinase